MTTDYQARLAELHAQRKALADEIVRLDCRIAAMEETYELLRGAEPEPKRRKRRDIRAMVKEQMDKWGEADYDAGKLAEQIGCRKSQVEAAVEHWRKSVIHPTTLFGGTKDAAQ